MGEDQVLVQPGAGAGRQCRYIDFSGRHHHLLPALAEVVAELVTIHRCRPEVVNQPQLLQLGIGLQQRLCIPQANVFDSAWRLLEIGCGELLFGVKGAHLHPVQIKGLACALDHAFEIGLLHLQLAWLHHQFLQQGSRHEFYKRKRQRRNGCR